MSIFPTWRECCNLCKRADTRPNMGTTLLFTNTRRPFNQEVHLFWKTFSFVKQDYNFINDYTSLHFFLPFAYALEWSTTMFGKQENMQFQLSTFGGPQLNSMKKSPLVGLQNVLCFVLFSTTNFQINCIKYERDAGADALDFMDPVFDQALDYVDQFERSKRAF